MKKFKKSIYAVCPESEIAGYEMAIFKERIKLAMLELDKIQIEMSETCSEDLIQETFNDAENEINGGWS